MMNDNNEKNNSELLIESLADVFKDIDNLKDEEIQKSIDEIKEEAEKIKNR